MADTKTDNSAVDLKVKVREWVLDRLAVPPSELSVLDLYCGQQGEMYQRVWSKAGHYLGVDKNRPHRLAKTMRASAEMAVQELDLSLFNCFDVDCYDSPWAVARRILRRCGHGRFGLVLTEGTARSLKSGDCNEVIRATLGLGALSNLTLMIRFNDVVTRLMLASLVSLPRVRLECAIEGVVRKQNVIKYLGLVVDKAAR